MGLRYGVDYSRQGISSKSQRGAIPPVFHALSFEVLFDCGWENADSFVSPLIGWGSVHKFS